MYVVLNLYAIYACNGTINILLPFTDLLHNTRPYVAHPTSFSSHLLLRSWDVSSSLYLLFIKANTYLSYNLRYYLQYTSSLTKLRLTILGQLQLEFKRLWAPEILTLRCQHSQQTILTQWPLWYQSSAMTEATGPTTNLSIIRRHPGTWVRIGRSDQSDLSPTVRPWSDPSDPP